MRKNYRLMGRVRAVPRLCELYAGVCLRIEEKAGKNLRRLNVNTTLACSCICSEYFVINK